MIKPQGKYHPSLLSRRWWWLKDKSEHFHSSFQTIRGYRWNVLYAKTEIVWSTGETRNLFFSCTCGCRFTSGLRILRNVFHLFSLPIDFLLLSDRHPVLFYCRFTMVTWRSFTLHVSSVILLWISINSQRQAVPANVTPRTFCMFLGRLINFPTNGIARTLQRNARSLTANKLEARHPQFPWQCRRTRQPAALPRFSANHGFSRIRCEQGLTFERRPRYAAKRLKKCLEGIKRRLSPRPIVQQASFISLILAFNKEVDKLGHQRD